MKTQWKWWISDKLNVTTLMKNEEAKPNSISATMDESETIVIIKLM